MPFATARARKLSTHWANGCAADCAKAWWASASDAAALNVVFRRVRRARFMRSLYRRIVARILPPGPPICYGSLERNGAEEPMTEIARRGVITGAGAGLMSGLLSEANAQAAKPDIQANEYWAQKGDVKLWVYRKRAAAKSGEKQPVVFLVHGSSISSRPSFDLGVPGYSMMDDL